MQVQSTIHMLYQPVQPAVNPSNAGVAYREIAPDAILKPFIYCYWHLKTSEPLANPFIYRVVADGCMDVFFEASRPDKHFVMGFCEQFTEFPLSASFEYIGVRFYPAMFPLLFQVHAAALTNRFEILHDVAPDLSSFITSAFDKKMLPGDIKLLFDNYFEKQLSQTALNFDSRLFEAIDEVLRQKGQVNIEKDLAKGISPRQLRRIFEQYIGGTPKTFSKIIRFQSLLGAKPSVAYLRKNKVFYEAGYYDQSHFIKEFRNFYGVSPVQAFRK